MSTAASAPEDDFEAVEEATEIPTDSFDEERKPASQRGSHEKRPGKRKRMSNREVYNTVTDIAGGPNVRWKDNLIQLACIVVATFLGVAVGPLFAPNVPVGLIVGGFVGLVVGLVGSGAAIGIYRTWRHAKGKHD